MSTINLHHCTVGQYKRLLKNENLAERVFGAMRCVRYPVGRDGLSNQLILSTFWGQSKRRDSCFLQRLSISKRTNALMYPTHQGCRLQYFFSPHCGHAVLVSGRLNATDCSRFFSGGIRGFSANIGKYLLIGCEIGR